MNVTLTNDSHGTMATFRPVTITEGRFLRVATGAERKGSKPKLDAMARLSEEAGREVVFKPYGSQGSGFYEAV